MSKKSGTVLIIEDDDASRDMLSGWLTRDGITNVAVASGEEALEVAAGLPIAAAIIDIRLPGMDGYEVLSELQQRDLLRPGTALTLTAYYSDEERVRALQAGFVECLGKPIKAMQLMPLLSGLLAA